MGFGTGSYAKIWEIKRGESGKYTDVRISVSKKNKETNQYEETFGGFVRLIGTAHKEADKLSVGDRIKLGSIDVESRYDKEKKQTFYNFKVFSFEPADGGGSAKTSPAENPVDGDNDPF